MANPEIMQVKVATCSLCECCVDCVSRGPSEVVINGVAGCATINALW